MKGQGWASGLVGKASKMMAEAPIEAIRTGAKAPDTSSGGEDTGEQYRHADGDRGAQYIACGQWRSVGQATLEQGEHFLSNPGFNRSFKL